MDNSVTQAAERLAELTLIWIGYGTVVGLLAKAIMPGRDPGGTVATVAMGIGGSIIGAGVLAFFWEGRRVTPISTVGFLVGTGGAFVLLAFYRLLAGYYFTEGHAGYRSRRVYTTRRRTRPTRGVIIDD